MIEKRDFMSKIQYKCRVCNNDQDNDILFSKELVIGTKKIFPYIYCSKCNSLSICDIPTNMDFYYEQYPYISNFDSGYKDNFLRRIIKLYILKNSNKLASFSMKFLDYYDDLMIKSLFPYKISKDSSILDVGSGSGLFLNILRNLGYKNCLGIDPNIKQEINLSNGFKILKKTIEELEGEYDLITFHHSFEHMLNPKQVLEKISQLLKPNGICLLRFPNVDSFSFKKFKEYWEGIHAPFHFFLPSEKGMEILLKGSNLKIIEKRGEQLTELFLHSRNYALGIPDFDVLGLRRFLNNKPLRNRLPPLFSKQEIRYWHQFNKVVLKAQSTDYVGYYITKK